MKSIWKKLCIAIESKNMIHYKSSREQQDCDGKEDNESNEELKKNLKNFLKKPLALSKQT